MKRSALFYLHQKAGASFAEHYGWEMPSDFASSLSEGPQVREHVGLADLSYRPKFDTKSQPSQTSWRLSKNRYLVVGEPPLDPPPRATEVTSVYTNLFLAGPWSQAVLGKLTSLNVSGAALPNLSCAQASLAHVPAIVLHEDIGPILGFHLLVSREYSESVWKAVLHAGNEFHLQPFGLSALKMLRI
jgi:glycine cleavage system aminomethyltransferase T